uniref:Uncharacterized protein n=1 Tax=Mesocestoides corti TaxID=53468 RepID=A0A5K3G3I6_MESCO
MVIKYANGGGGDGGGDIRCGPTKNSAQRASVHTHTDLGLGVSTRHSQPSRPREWRRSWMCSTQSVPTVLGGSGGGGGGGAAAAAAAAAAAYLRYEPTHSTTTTSHENNLLPS